MSSFIITFYKQQRGPSIGNSPELKVLTDNEGNESVTLTFRIRESKTEVLSNFVLHLICRLQMLSNWSYPKFCRLIKKIHKVGPERVTLVFHQKYHKKSRTEKLILCLDLSGSILSLTVRETDSIKHSISEPNFPWFISFIPQMLQTFIKFCQDIKNFCTIGTQREST